MITRQLGRFLVYLDCPCGKRLTVTFLHGWLQIDAAIVRVMKTRKVLSHTLLITELFQQVNSSIFNSLFHIKQSRVMILPLLILDSFW